MNNLGGSDLPMQITQSQPINQPSHQLEDFAQNDADQENYNSERDAYRDPVQEQQVRSVSARHHSSQRQEYLD